MGAFIRHLNVVVHVDLRNDGFADSQLDTTSAIQCMDALDGLFPNLKTCVLTADMDHVVKKSGSGRYTVFDPRFLRANYKRNNKHEFDSVHAEIAQLFESFANKGPAKSRFVRARFCDFVQVHTGQSGGRHHNYGPLVGVQRSEMADESQNPTLGLRLLDATYRLKRTGPCLMPWIVRHG